MKRMLIVVLFVSFVSQALAFYNPGQGRWMSRDPVDEVGFVVSNSGRQPAMENKSDEELYTGRPVNRAPRELNRYGFVLNDPIDHIDPLGLISFNGCSESQKAELTAAWNAGCSKINDPRFACCMNRSGLTTLLRRRCSWGNVTFYCRDNGTFWCDKGTCAHAWRSVLPGINAGRITVCYPLAQNCGSLGMPCLLMHELAHVVSAGPGHGVNSAATKTEVCCQGF
jgi:hypothetical protein